MWKAVGQAVAIAAPDHVIEFEVEWHRLYTDLGGATPSLELDDLLFLAGRPLRVVVRTGGRTAFEGRQRLLRQLTGRAYVDPPIATDDLMAFVSEEGILVEAWLRQERFNALRNAVAEYVCSEMLKHFTLTFGSTVTVDGLCVGLDPFQRDAFLTGETDGILFCPDTLNVRFGFAIACPEAPSDAGYLQELQRQFD